jgi:hypothetical protein
MQALFVDSIAPGGGKKLMDGFEAWHGSLLQFWSGRALE